MRLSRRHPRYASLLVRARLARAMRRGLVVPEGLVAHGRGEAFDYLLGERTSPSARRAERVAALWLLGARRPVVSVNGNVAALAAAEVAALQRAVAKRLGQVFGKTVRAHFRTEPSLLGGVVVRSGDRVFDGSLRRRLKILRQRMLHARLGGGEVAR